MKKLFLRIGVIAVCLLFVLYFVIPAYAYRNTHELFSVLYMCTMGIGPHLTKTISYSNETHSINYMDCEWEENKKKTYTQP